MAGDTQTATLLYVYGVTEAGEAPGARGVAGSPVSAITEDGVSVLVSELPGLERVALGRDELTAHARVVEAAHAAGPVLPMRFGVVMESEAAIREEFLLPYREALAHQLESMVGKAEMRVRATYEEQALMREVVSEERAVADLRESIRGKSDDATYYDRIRLGELVADAVAERRQRDTAALLERLAPFVLETVSGDPSHERVALNASFLVAQDRLEDFDAALEQIGREQAGRLRLRATGPLPPYSFVSLGEGGS